MDWSFSWRIWQSIYGLDVG